MSVIMSEIDAYKIQQIVDNGNAVQISLVEDVQTEPLSQKQLIIENVSKKLDDDTKKQVMPLLDAILQAQPTIRVKSYAISDKSDSGNEQLKFLQTNTFVLSS